MQSVSFRFPSLKGNYFNILRPCIELLNRNCRRDYIGIPHWSFDDIPGPFLFPYIGNLWRYTPVIGQYDIQRQHLTYRKMYEKYGGLVKEKIYQGRETVHVFNREDISLVYQNEGPTPLCPSHQALLQYRRDRPHIYHSAGFLVGNGEDWLRLRNMFQDILLDPGAVGSLFSGFEDIAEDFMENVKNYPIAMQKDFLPHLLKWSLENFVLMIFNRRLGCLSEDKDEEAKEMVKRTLDIRNSLFLSKHCFPLFQSVQTPTYRKLIISQDYLEGLIKGFMKEATYSSGQCKEEGSIFAKMLAVPGATENDVFIAILDMFLAGVDTTAYAAGFAFYNLACHVVVQDLLFKDLVKILPETTSRLEGREWRFPYLESIVNETLRLFPLSYGVGRILTKDLILAKYRVKAGSKVMLQHQVASRNRDNFAFPNAFIPTRWIEGSGLYEEPKPELFRPFGDGPRMCLGKEFAETLLLMFVTKMMRRYEVYYHFGAYGPLDIRTRTVNMPDKPVRLLFGGRYIDVSSMILKTPIKKHERDDDKF